MYEMTTEPTRYSGATIARSSAMRIRITTTTVTATMSRISRS
ncbi:Uncharacterised protein [Mycobacterium tuberculosis]|uniref:Uncharacterized protein n=1 Tax=Mycobacterium tuberculosis TaxID=1773 RepID=A0A0T7PR29_MYCTX|nr:Uncharacterised protein [Mycobacterium tuberculosis]CFS33493.1 Uncharacterised protein [Mycobacterium tuberculosis]COX35359.1 Uncharacterised protein [Mycobacterium tuberculosis]COZ10951.1 Uncharacterised protein [Mycobacterium tuberculosis]